jgi:hypothetical protein
MVEPLVADLQKRTGPSPGDRVGDGPARAQNGMAGEGLSEREPANYRLQLGPAQVLPEV